MLLFDTLPSLTNKDRLRELIGFLKNPSNDDLKLPTLASQVFVAANEGFMRAVVADGVAMSELWGFLNTTHASHPVLASYFVHSVSAVLAQVPEEALRFFKLQDRPLMHLLERADASALYALYSDLTQTAAEASADLLEWVTSQQPLDLLLNKIASTVDHEVGLPAMIDFSLISGEGMRKPWAALY